MPRGAQGPGGQSHGSQAAVAEAPCGVAAASGRAGPRPAGQTDRRVVSCVRCGEWPRSRPGAPQGGRSCAGQQCPAWRSPRCARTALRTGPESRRVPGTRPRPGSSACRQPTSHAVTLGWPPWRLPVFRARRREREQAGWFLPVRSPEQPSRPAPPWRPPRAQPRALRDSDVRTGQSARASPHGTEWLARPGEREQSEPCAPAQDHSPALQGAGSAGGGGRRGAGSGAGPGGVEPASARTTARRALLHDLPEGGGRVPGA